MSKDNQKPFRAGDTVRVSIDCCLVACDEHDGVVHLADVRPRTVPRIICELVRAATDAEREAMLRYWATRSEPSRTELARQQLSGLLNPISKGGAQ